MSVDLDLVELEELLGGSASVDGVLIYVHDSGLSMGGEDLRVVRVAVAIVAVTWAAAGVLVFVRYGVLASVVGVVWGGSMVVSAAATLERRLLRVARREQVRETPAPSMLVLDDAAAA